MLAAARDHRKLASASDVQKLSRVELLVVIFCIAAILAANLVTAELYPRAWNDEAQWVDPAINLLRGNGLTSSTWYYSLFGQFWFGNTPLYPAVLSVWAKITGDGFTALRSLSFVWISLAALLLYQFACRSSELISARSRIALALVPLLGYGVTFAYRSARPDALCIFLMALLLVATTLKNPALRRGSVIGVSALLPWAEPALVAYAVGAAVLIVLGSGRRHLRPILWMATGLTAGLFLMFAFYAAAGHLKDFLITTLLSQRSVFGQAAQYIVLSDDRGAARFMPSAILGALTEDPSTVLGFLAAAILLTMARVRRSPEVAYRLRASIAAAVLIPFGMYCAGQFNTYYSWMALVPTWFFLLAAVDRLEGPARLEQTIAYAFLACSLLVGWPLLVGASVVDASRRDYGQVRELVGQAVRPGEWALVSPQAYFAVVETGGVPFLGEWYATSRLMPNIPDDEQKRFSAIVTTPREADKFLARLPGHWTKVASLRDTSHPIPVLSWLLAPDHNLKSDSYDLNAYRRTP